MYGDGNVLDFGARIYDSRLGRWLSIDPKGYLYRDLSPYSAFGCSPIYIIDPGGETLRVITTDPLLIDKYKTLVSVAFNGKVNAIVGENGIVNFEIVDGAMLNDLEFSGFISLVEVAESDHSVKMNLIDHNDPLSSVILFDSYKKETVDLDDVLKMGTEDYTFNSRGILVHISSEYLEKAEMRDRGKPVENMYNWCHSTGLDDEARTSGFERNHENDLTGRCPTRLEFKIEGMEKEKKVNFPTENPNSFSNYKINLELENGYNIKSVKYEKIPD